MSGQLRPHQTLLLPVFKEATSANHHLCGAAGRRALIYLGSQTANRWKRFYSLPLGARENSMLEVSAVCCSSLNTDGKALQISFVVRKKLFKPSSDFCGVCRDHLSRDQRGLADITALKTHAGPCPQRSAPINQKLQHK